MRAERSELGGVQGPPPINIGADRERSGASSEVRAERSELGGVQGPPPINIGAEEGIRTPTVLLPPAPQAGASASSATSAFRGLIGFCSDAMPSVLVRLPLQALSDGSLRVPQA